jgi:hypothetical protein
MPADATRILAILGEMEAATSEGLRQMDRDLIQSIRDVLRAHRIEVDKVLLKLAFVMDQQIN